MKSQMLGLWRLNAGVGLRGAAAIAMVATLPSCSNAPAAGPQNSLTNASGASQAVPATNAAAGNGAELMPAAIQEKVALEDDNGTLRVPVLINDAVKVKFTIDSGATDVVIPADVAMTLVRSGTITRDDYIGSQTFVLADGSQVPSPLFRIHSLKIGNLEIRNVEASLTNQNGGLLLGQTFLARLSSWSIDNERQTLNLSAPAGGLTSATQNPTIAAVATPAPEPPAVSPPPAVAPVAGDEKTPGSAATDAAGVEAGAASRAVSFYQTWSGSDAQGVLKVRPYFADSVLYYGSTISRDDVMAKQIQFAARWPVRQYAVRDGSLTTTCYPDHACMVAGLVDWRASSPADARYSSGTARFTFVFRDGLIIAESGKVVARN